MSDGALVVRDMRIGSHAGPIVRGLSLEVALGETIGIVGESGSGKSMTAKALIGLLPQGVEAEGSATLDGVGLLSSTRREWQRLRGREVALLLQDPFTMLDPLMRVGAQITETVRDPEGRRLSRAARRVEAVRRLAEVGIRDERVVDLYPFQLSGGMRQRVGLAAALATDPRLLIADEPSTALDVTSQREILRLLRATQRLRQMSLILITHDLRVAFSVCDRIYVLYAGTLVEVGEAAALERAPLHPYTRGLLASEPPLDVRVERLEAIPGSVPPAAEVLGECVFAERCRWVDDRCRSGEPPLTQSGDGRLTACLRVDEIRNDLVMTKVAHTATVRSGVEADGAHVVSVRSLSKHFRRGSSEHAALSGVTLHVDGGEAVGLVGESGSGKTTVARCIVGLERASGGAIEIEGLDVTDSESLSAATRAAVRRSVQMVFQDPYSTLNPAHTVGFILRETVRRLPDTPRDIRRATAELLEVVGLPAGYLSRKPAALSGGERQRVAIARALALRPRVLICDEPVSALDVSVQAQILNLFRDLQRDLGLGYLFISHDLAVVRQVTDRLHVLYRGSVVESGTTEQVLRSPSHEYTRMLIDSIPQSDPSWLAADAAVP